MRIAKNQVLNPFFVAVLIPLDPAADKRIRWMLRKNKKTEPRTIFDSYHLAKLNVSLLMGKRRKNKEKHGLKKKKSKYM